VAGGGRQAEPRHPAVDAPTSSSNERQYWITVGAIGERSTCQLPRQPSAGSASSSFRSLGIVPSMNATFRSFQGRFRRIPIRKTTKSPSMSALQRPGKISGMA
jgi:hypothetical protein